MGYKHWIEIDGEKYTRKSTSRKYTHVVIGKRVNAELEYVTGYTTPYGEQFCGNEVICRDGYKTKCAIYASRLDDPKIETDCRKIAQEIYPNREIIMETAIRKGSGSLSIWERENGFKVGEYGHFHCSIHEHQQFQCAHYSFYAKRIQPETNPHKFQVLSWHTSYALAESGSGQYKHQKLPKGEYTFEEIRIVEVPEENITEVKKRIKKETE